MIIALAAISLALGAMPGLLRPWGRRLHPGDWARGVAVCFMAALVLWELTLLVVAAPVVLRAAGAHELAAACARMVGRLIPGGWWLGWPALVGAVMLPCIVGAGVRRAKSAQQVLAEIALVGHRTMLVGHEVVVVDDQRPLAVSVDAYGGVVVVSSALVEQLDDDELAAVVRHELAHLEHRHHRLLQLAAGAECAFGFLPGARSGVDGLRCAIERWADEDAAGHDSCIRGLTRRALVGVAIGGLSVDAAAFGGLSTVVERVTALEGPAPAPSGARRFTTLAPLALGGVGAVFAAVLIVAHLWFVMTMPVICPS